MMRNHEDAAHLSELEALAEAKPNLTIELWESKERGRLGAQQVAEIAGDSIRGARVSFCGPVEMRTALGDGLRRYGVAQKDFHYEAFEIRTGIGLKTLANWLWARRPASVS